MRYQIEPQIEKASTIPSAFYTSAAEFEKAKEAIFARSWQWVADPSTCTVPGAIHPFTLLEGALDEPLILTRDDNDQVRCLSNVCTHRGNLVVEGASVQKSMRCRYHGRKFGLDGACQFMPEFEGVEGFPCPADNLTQIPLQQWRGHFFVSPDPLSGPAPDLQQIFAQIEERIGWLPIEQFQPDPTTGREYLVRAHWALYVDNYLEGFHIPYIHPALNATLNYSEYDTELLQYGNLQLGVAGTGEPAFDLPESSPDYGKRIGAYYYWLFPNTMLNFYPWGLSINVVRPLAPDLTKVEFIPFVWDASKRAQGAGAALDRVEREDEAVVEMVQRCVRSRYYDRGRYSPRRERGVHQFHQMIATAMNSLP